MCVWWEHAGTRAAQRKYSYELLLHFYTILSYLLYLRKFCRRIPRKCRKVENYFADNLSVSGLGAQMILVGIRLAQLLSVERNWQIPLNNYFYTIAISEKIEHVWLTNSVSKDFQFCFAWMLFKRSHSLPDSVGCVAQNEMSRNPHSHHSASEHVEC